MNKLGRIKITKPLLITLAGFGLVLAVSFVTRIQTLISEARIPESTGEVNVDRSEEGEFAKYDISFKTGNLEENPAMSFLGFRLKLPEGTRVFNNEGVAANGLVVADEFLESEDWEFPVNKVEITDEELIIDFAAINTTKEGFRSNDFVKIASFYTREASDLEGLEIRVDKERANMYTKSRPVTNIWEAPETLPVNLSF